MKAIVCVLVLAAAGLFAHAAGSGDPLDSPECRAARAELEQALDGSGADGRQRLERARRQARELCLGRADAQPQRSGAPDVPAIVPAPVLAPPRPLPLPPPAASSAGPVLIPHATPITTCDPGGCWDSEGRRLNQTGPLLMGPNGLCTMQSGRVTCP
jgi:hypothetical protein